MVLWERPFILLLIQKIPNSKTWVLSCLKDGSETLVGHTDMHVFVDSFGWPMIQYKVSPTNSIWNPIEVFHLKHFLVN